ncbi:hypothetical protein N7456_005319 [Penicillium angulare]|uniref:DHHA2 domain-containing protein n=1 Tax=Penicillium angulare TaxID=116970 RepID=A0A9W9KJ67_9EURO|nr:hypothetical protein N7456_005319 [Penicillium angulare]
MTMTPLQFLRQARQIHLQFLSGTLSESPIYVLGNPSADLDSIISAIIYSYCANNRLPKNTPRPHIPLLNLSNVPAGPELFRLRPEFVTALWLSTNFPALKPEERFEDSYESAGNLLREHIITVADFAQGLRDRKIQGQTQNVNVHADVTLVDWNALPETVPGTEGSGSLGAALEGVTFRAVGCIDHHVNDNFMPSAENLPDGQPVIIQPGPGSCASLIANEMHSRGIWASAASSEAASSKHEVAQISKLALAPILIDTSNLTAKDKVTDVDLQAVEFLRQLIATNDGNSGVDKWDEQEFYSRIFEAKVNSLDRLTLQEVLGRDYKEWSESARSGQKLTVGFCSAVKPIRWIVKKAGGPKEFMHGVREFSSSEGRELDAVVVMTAFTSDKGEFSRELFISAIGDCEPVVDGINVFVDNADQLQLVNWSAVDSESVDIHDEEIRSTLDGDEGIWRRLWIQKDVKGSRKQVAPLVRSALRQVKI